MPALQIQNLRKALSAPEPNLKNAVLNLVQWENYNILFFSKNKGLIQKEPFFLAP